MKTSTNSNLLGSSKTDSSARKFMIPAVLGLALGTGIQQASLAGNFGYVDYGPGDTFFEIRNGSLYAIGFGGKPYKEIGKPVKVNSNILRVDSTYYCRWEGYAEQQVKKFNSSGAQWYCTPSGIRAKPIKSTAAQKYVKTHSNVATSSNGPSFSGSGARSPGVWVKKVFQPNLGTMRVGKNYFGHGVVNLQLTSRDLGTNYAITRSFSINCTTRNWSFLDPDVAWFGGTQELFGKFSFSAIGAWACNRYGYKY